MEIVIRIIGRNAGRQRACLQQRVAVDLDQLTDCNSIPRRVEVGGIGEQETQRVADPPVGFDHAFQYLVADRHVARKIGRAHPEAQDFGAQRVRDFLRRDDVTSGFRHLAALAVDDESMRQQRLVWRHAVQHGRDEQRRMEPAAVLIRSLEIEIGGKSGVERS